MRSGVSASAGARERILQFGQGCPGDRGDRDQEAETDGPDRREPKCQRRGDGQAAAAHAGQRGEHLGQADQECVQKGRLGRPLLACRSTQLQAHQQQDGGRDEEADAGRLTALESLLDPVDEEELQRDQGQRGDNRQQPDPPDRGALKTRGHVLRSQQESPRPGHDRISVMQENRCQRPHVEHDVEKQVLLTAVRSAGQPGKDLLGHDQVAVAGDRQELGDALHHAEDQRFNPFHVNPS